jgi:hypothetical protein
MLTALWWLLAALGGLVLLAVLVLATPVKLDLALRTSPGWRLKITVRLFAGLTPPVPVHDSARPKRREAKRPAPGKPAAARRRKTPARALRALAGAPRLLAGLLRPISLERLTVDADIGLDDPADTGQLAGLLNAFVHAWPLRPDVSIAVRPDFAGPRAEGRVDARLSFIPIAFVPPGIRFAWRVYGPG